MRAFLVEHRVPEADIAKAEEEDVLDLLVVDCLLVPGERYTQSEVAEITGMPEEMASRFWRALGFADVTADDKIFTDLDIEAIRILQTMVDLGAADVDTVIAAGPRHRFLHGPHRRGRGGTGRARDAGGAGSRCRVRASRRPTASSGWPTVRCRP